MAEFEGGNFGGHEGHDHGFEGRGDFGGHEGHHDAEAENRTIILPEHSERHIAESEARETQIAENQVAEAQGAHARNQPTGVINEQAAEQALITPSPQTETRTQTPATQPRPGSELAIARERDILTKAINNPQSLTPEEKTEYTRLTGKTIEEPKPVEPPKEINYTKVVDQYTQDKEAAERGVKRGFHIPVASALLGGALQSPLVGIANATPISGITAGVTSLLTSMKRRGEGENAFSFFERYSKTDGSWFGWKTLRLFTRGLERAALKRQIALTPSGTVRRVLSWMDDHGDIVNPHRFNKLSKDDLQKAIKDITWFLTSTSAVSGLGAYLTENEQKGMSMKAKASEALKTLTKTLHTKDTKTNAFIDTLPEEIVNRESGAYKKQAGFVAAIGAAKAMALTSLATNVVNSAREFFGVKGWHVEPSSKDPIGEGATNFLNRIKERLGIPTPPLDATVAYTYPTPDYHHDTIFNLNGAIKGSDVSSLNGTVEGLMYQNSVAPASYVDPLSNRAPFEAWWNSNVDAHTVARDAFTQEIVQENPGKVVPFVNWTFHKDLFGNLNVFKFPLGLFRKAA